MTTENLTKSTHDELTTLIFLILADSHSGSRHRLILETAVATNASFDATLAVLIEAVISKGFEIRCRSDALKDN